MRTTVDIEFHQLGSPVEVRAFGSRLPFQERSSASYVAAPEACIGRIKALARERWGDVALEEAVREELETVLDDDRARITVAGDGGRNAASASTPMTSPARVTASVRPVSAARTNPHTSSAPPNEISEAPGQGAAQVPRPIGWQPMPRRARAKNPLNF